MKVLRVFPRKTNATPNDENVVIGRMPNLFDNADNILISVTFTYDIPYAEKLYKAWSNVASTNMGGPAFNEPGGNFIPGQFLKIGYTITSRGCNNNCWFCSVPKREGKVRELPIMDGWVILDDNLLSCSNNHINNVFEMLKRQPYRPLFTGGLEARLLTDETAKKLKELKPKALYFAYDTKDDLEPLYAAGKILINAGFSNKSHALRCYVLCGYKGDTFEKAQKRFLQAYEAGFLPMAMHYRDESGYRNPEWVSWLWQWIRPITTACNCKKLSKVI